MGEGDVEEEAGTRAHGHTSIRARVHTDSQGWDRGEVRSDKVRHVERRARECSAALGKVGSDVVGAGLGRRPCGGGAALAWSGRPRRTAPASSRQRPTPQHLSEPWIAAAVANDSTCTMHFIIPQPPLVSTVVNSTMARSRRGNANRQRSRQPSLKHASAHAPQASTQVEIAVTSSMLSMAM